MKISVRTILVTNCKAVAECVQFYSNSALVVNGKGMRVLGGHVNKTCVLADAVFMCCTEPAGILSRTLRNKRVLCC